MTALKLTMLPGIVAPENEKHMERPSGFLESIGERKKCYFTLPAQERRRETIRIIKEDE